MPGTSSASPLPASRAAGEARPLVAVDADRLTGLIYGAALALHVQWPEGSRPAPVTSALDRLDDALRMLREHAADAGAHAAGPEAAGAPSPRRPAVAAVRVGRAGESVDPAAAVARSQVWAPLRPVPRVATAGSRSVRLVSRCALPEGDGAPSAARRLVRERCSRWGLADVAANLAIDVASELVTNAAHYGGGRPRLRLQLEPGRLVVEVTDDTTDLPQLLPYRGGYSERGLGLRLVARLSAEWGVELRGAGKVVWAAIDVEPGARAAVVRPGRVRPPRPAG